MRKYSLFPKTLAQCIEPLTRPVLKTQGLAGTQVLTQWGSIVGPTLSQHTLPEKLSFPKGKKSGGTLTISVENGFATELMHMQPVILERINAYFGYPAVVRMSISHGWVHVEPPAPPPLKPVLKRDSVALTDEITDPELKEALKSLAETLSGRI